MDNKTDQANISSILDKLNLDSVNSGTIDDIIRQTIIKGKTEEPFYVFNILDVFRKHKKWLLCMPRVKPFYAIKCNPNPLVLQVLSALGVGFDCASKREIESVLNIGVNPNDIIYANTCKFGSHMTYAAQNGVQLMTFDNELELYKVRQLTTNSRMVLRIKTNDRHSSVQLSDKFGADLSEVSQLLQTAKTIGVNIIGCSFHVGMGCKDPDVYTSAIKDAKYVFDLGRDMGFNMTLLDLGGGYPGSLANNPNVISFEKIALVINKALDLYFPDVDEMGMNNNYNIIAEPGQYYVGSAFTLATNIIAKNTVESNDRVVTQHYYLNDGIYGSFALNIFHDEIYEYIPLSIDKSLDNRTEYMTTLWGPSCSSIDCVLNDIKLTELNIGEWLIFRDMGAYTISMFAEFNGFKIPAIVYYLPENERKILWNSQNFKKIDFILKNDE